MNDRWMVRGREFSNCNCNWGCPCQFNAPSTHGHCEAIGSGIVDEGYFNDTSLDGLHWVLLLQWPGEISAGNGTQQAIIDERATPQQRESLRRILHGEATKPGATGFYVYNSTMSTVLETLFAPVTVEVDVEGRRASILVPGLIESRGTPIIDPLSGQEHRAGISLPDGFEYTFAEMGSGSTQSSAAIALELKDSYGQFNYMHLTQDGVIR
jgi:hypothetical protein